MNSESRPATEAISRPSARAFRAAALVGFVWTIAALPFALGLVHCPTAQLFHFPCPGCGMTRAFHLLLAGDVRRSLAMHPLAVPTFLSQAVLAAATVVATFQLGAPWSLVRTRWGRAAIVFVVVVMSADVLLWIARALGAFGGAVSV